MSSSSRRLGYGELEPELVQGEAQHRTSGYTACFRFLNVIRKRYQVVLDDLANFPLERAADLGREGEAIQWRRLTPTEVVTFIESVFPSDADGEVSRTLAERRADVAELVWRGVGAELAMSETDGQPNPWVCYNAVTEYFDHVVTGKAKTNNATRIANTSALFGSGSAFKLSALRQAQSLVAA